MYSEERFKENFEKFIFSGVDENYRSRGKQQSRYDAMYYQEREMGYYVELLVKEFGDLRGKKILEIGSGGGGLAVALARAGAIVSGVEPDINGVNTATLRAERYPEVQADFKLGTGENITYGDGLFDIVLIISVIEHVQDPAQVAREIFRVLKPGGRCFLDAPNYIWPYELHYRIWYPPLIPKPLGKLYLRLRGKNTAEIDSINYVTPRRLAKLFLKAGFSKIINTTRADIIAKLDHPEDMGYSLRLKKILLAVRGNKFLYRPLSWILSVFLKLDIYPIVRLIVVK